MHKTETEDAITSLHDLSATDLLAGYRAKQFSPPEVMEAVLAHVAVWSRVVRALSLRSRRGARRVISP
jgi:aspartyl-tRNA(Asn)/glutamyl-tRNA(Gln) amidotransferase subunit A